MKAEAQRAQADWDEMARECAEQGFRPHYCIHGTNLWTDYDNICQGCENGEPLWDDARDWAEAKWRAEEALRKVEKRSKIAEQVFDEDRSNTDLIGEMSRWAFEPMSRLMKRFGI
jgi:hypothetical protein